MFAPNTRQPSTMAASTLCGPLLSGPLTRMHPAHRNREAWLLTAAGAPKRWVSLSTPRAVRLPHALVLPRLPAHCPRVGVGDGFLWYDEEPVEVRRWFTPPRVNRGVLAALAATPADVRRRLSGWSGRLGRGDGLTPYQDDVICGAMLGLLATDDPAADWLAEQLRCADLEARTTTASAALLRSACDGWCIPEVAAVVTALSTGRSPVEAVQRLTAVGHSSGRGVWAGMSGVLDLPARPVAA